MTSYTVPGIYREEIYLPPAPLFRTGVPAFLGYIHEGPAVPEPLTAWPQYMASFGNEAGSLLPAAVRGFFENGGELCYVVSLQSDLTPDDALQQALRRLELVPEVDLLCLPDAMRDPETGLRLQQQLVDWCDRSQERFAILDAPPGSSVADVLSQWRELDGKNAALYFPWIRVAGRAAGETASVPPCGHIAGLFSRTDRDSGFFAAPANRALEGVLDLEALLTDEMQRNGDPFGVVNCLRVFPGQGVRVWGARTISGQANWRSINVRRTLLSLNRWLNAVMPSLVYEPNTPALWARVRRTITGFLEDLHRRGGLAGATPAEAFFVHCDAMTTPPALREQGRVLAEIGFAPAVPSQFILVRLIFAPGEILLDNDAILLGKES